uniref:hypothetical protein n=1 Tax=Endozoicomonas atrinae TaxID=1333660 RepID=UPI000A5A6862
RVSLVKYLTFWNYQTCRPPQKAILNDRSFWTGVLRTFYAGDDRTTKPSQKQQLRLLIKEAVEDCMSTPNTERFPRFISSLRSKKIGVSAYIQSTGRITGLRFHFGIFTKRGIKGSALGKDYCWAQLASTVAFEDNTAVNTEILKLSDHRITEWVNHPSGGKKWATDIGNFYKNKMGHSNKTLALKTSVDSSSSPGSPESITPDFPENCPEWLKSYIRAIVRAANAELARAYQRKQEEIARSNQVLLRLLEDMVNILISKRIKQELSKVPSMEHQ